MQVPKKKKGKRRKKRKGREGGTRGKRERERKKEKERSNSSNPNKLFEDLADIGKDRNSQTHADRTQFQNFISSSARPSRVPGKNTT